MKHEYGALVCDDKKKVFDCFNEIFCLQECCVEIVKDLDEAISHIHRFGSSHTGDNICKSPFVIIIYFKFPRRRHRDRKP